MFYKYLPSAEHYESLKEIKILSFSYTELNDEPSILHSHLNCEIMVPLNDFGSMKFVNKIVPVQPNQIIVTNNNIMHTEIKQNKNGIFKYYAIRLGLEIKKKSADYFIIEDKELYEEITRYLTKAYSLLSIDNDDNLGILNLSCCYYQILSYFEKNGYSVKDIKSKVIPDYVVGAKNYIMSNYNRDFSINELAESLSISQNLLTLKFKEIYGVGPRKFLINTRLNMAKHLLSTSNYIISQISFLCGFKTPAYFTHVFNEEYGITPKEYREQRIKK